ncbi:MAG TPA: hypothetical protein PKC97_07670 [Burkholderiaceae bacterium]|nr:hypothetical protein [Burkholderiaceae bacterium]
MSLLMAMSTARSSNRSSWKAWPLYVAAKKARDARDLAGVSRLGQRQQSREGLGTGLRRLKRQRIAGGNFGIDGVLDHVRLLGCVRDSRPDGRAGRLRRRR